jgi:hypothetical protein
MLFTHWGSKLILHGPFFIPTETAGVCLQDPQPIVGILIQPDTFGTRCVLHFMSPVDMEIVVLLSVAHFFSLRLEQLCDLPRLGIT